MLLKRSTIALVLLVLLVGLMAASASATKADYIKKPADDGLVFTPVSSVGPTAFSTDGQFSTMATVYTIRQGQTNWHGKYIPSGCPGYYLDLNWGNPSNSLRLRVYGADGRIYGPFYDSSDGRIDGRILFWVTSGSGTLPPGTYYHEVYGESVYGVEDYTF
jgi:hypothetical protein